MAEARGLRQPGPLPTRWKNHLDKLLPHPRALKPVVHHAAMHFDAVPALFAKLVATDRDSRAVPRLHGPDRRANPRGARRSLGRDRLQGQEWTVPPSRMKRTREHRVPLSAEALKLIERLPRKGEYLFAVNGNGKPIVAMSLRKALHRHGGAGLHGARDAIGAFRTWADEHTNYAARVEGSRACARDRQPDRGGVCARRPAGEAPQADAGMGDAFAPHLQHAPAARWSACAVAAMDEAPKFTLDDLIAFGRLWEEHLAQADRRPWRIPPVDALPRSIRVDRKQCP